MKLTRNFLFAALFLCFACKTDTNQKSADSIKAPVAKKEPKELTIHGDTRTDPYFWMRLSDDQKKSENPDAQTQDVIDYLEAENSYLEAKMAHTDSLQTVLYDEIVGRIKEEDASVPVRDNGYLYYSRYEAGADYPLYCRKKSEEAEEEVMLNAPEMAEGYSYYGIGGQAVSANNRLLAFGVDTVSRRRYSLFFKDLEKNEMLEDVLSNTTGGAVWANDNKTVFYTSKDPVTLRSNKVYRHVLGTDQSEDVLVFEEKDETFSTYITKTKSNDFIIIASDQTLSSEFQYLDANKPTGNFKIVQPRERDLKYSIDHFGNEFYIRTNADGAKNFKLVKAPLSNPSKTNWTDVIPHRDSIYLQDYELFENHLVLTERKEGLREIRIMTWDKSADYYLEFNDPAYAVYTTGNRDFDTSTVRYIYTSLTTPTTTYEYDMNTKSQKMLKQEEVVGGYNPEDYSSERLFATATDGTKVPISLVYKKGTELSNNTPLLLYAYGSYGSSQEARFDDSRLSLLDRGFVYALAHVRGGQEMGRDWYENGKLLKKKNTFTDFIDCGRFLVEKGYTSSDHLYAYGGSAGGLLMGAILNMEPSLWNGVIAAVPFVDVISTMLDETIPLTTFEFDEWGNPKDKTYYDYMLSYSPYDNVEAKDYPNILVTTGYWDSQVQYWEPAKWVAKLRDMKTDDNLLIMDCNMETGHGGASGRFERYKRSALVYAFMLDLENQKG